MQVETDRERQIGRLRGTERHIGLGRVRQTETERQGETKKSIMRERQTGKDERERQRETERKRQRGA